MLSRGSFKAKHIFVLVVILFVIFLELGIFLSREVPSLDLASIDVLKISASDPLKPPQGCMSQPEGYKKVHCFKEYFEAITERVSTRAAMAQAKNFEEEGVVSDCHFLGHFIGRSAMEKHDFNIGKAFSSCTLQCMQSCFHGAMERYIDNETGSDADDIDVSKIKNACDRLRADPSRHYACIHSVGHGLAEHDYLPVQDAVDVCNAFKPKEFADICIGGLAMGTAYKYIFDSSVDDDRLEKIIPKACAAIVAIGSIHLRNFREQGQVWPEECVYSITITLMDYTGHDVERTKELCEWFQPLGYENTCKDEIFRVIEDHDADSEVIEDHDADSEVIEDHDADSERIYKITLPAGFTIGSATSTERSTSVEVADPIVNPLGK